MRLVPQRQHRNQFTRSNNASGSNWERRIGRGLLELAVVRRYLVVRDELALDAVLGDGHRADAAARGAVSGHGVRDCLGHEIAALFLRKVGLRVGGEMVKWKGMRAWARSSVVPIKSTASAARQEPKVRDQREPGMHMHRLICPPLHE